MCFLGAPATTLLEKGIEQYKTCDNSESDADPHGVRLSVVGGKASVVADAAIRAKSRHFNLLGV